MPSQYILIVDDEPDICQLVSEILEDEGYEVAVAGNAEQAREKWRLKKPELVLLDIWMPDEDGISLLKSWQEASSLCCPVVMMSGHATIETAVEATRLGAYDFIEKPLSMAKLLLTVENALRTGQLEVENKSLKSQMSIADEPIGNSEILRNLRSQAERIAEHGSSVLLMGESGVGKEVFARFMHNLSPRKDSPFIKAIITNSNDGSTSTKLFGKQENGQIQFGLIDEANAGTLYLNDIAALDKETQERLYSMIKEGQFTRVGGSERINANLRLMVSTMHDLREDLEAKRFNEELYYLLDVVPLIIPPLRDHPEDVPELLNYYVDHLTANDNLPYRHFSVPAQNYLRNHHWAGNIRELRNLVQRLLILGTEVEITLEEAEEALGTNIPVYQEGVGQIPNSLFDLPLRQAREQFEHDYLTWQLKQTKGNVSRLAERVKMERTHLYRKMRSLNIDPKKYGRNT